MKKMIILIAVLVLAMMMAIAGCGTEEQASTATARLTEGDHTTMATVDLSGGWSVQFATGAVYLYEGVNDGEVDCTAMVVTLEKKVYDEYVTGYKDEESYKQSDGKITYIDPDTSETVFMVTTENDMYYKVTVAEGVDADAVLTRLTLEAET